MNQRSASANPQDVVEAVRQTGLIDPERPILIMFSGGGDSVALLDSAVTLSSNERVIAFHQNYELRGGQSEEDAAFCAAFCERLGVELIVERAPGGFALEPGNLQDRARDLRYGAAERIADERGIATIAAAHTADDQAETILYRLFSSPGRRALAGMAPRRGRLVRPLLGLRREQLRQFNRARGNDWREDASNQDERFARVRSRRLLAAAEELHPAAVANLLASAAELRAESDALTTVIAELLEDTTAEDGSLSAAALATLPPELAGPVLREFAERAAGRPLPAAPRALADVIRLAAKGGSHEVDIEGARLLIEYGAVSIAGAADPVPAPETALAIPGEVAFGDWRITAGGGGAELSAEISLAAGTAALTVRARREGDRMRPRGLGHAKSLHDLFIDRKIPRRQRAAHPVVCAGDEIVWVPGVAVAETAGNSPTKLTAARLH